MDRLVGLGLAVIGGIAVWHFWLSKKWVLIQAERYNNPSEWDRLDREGKVVLVKATDPKTGETKVYALGGQNAQYADEVAKYHLEQGHKVEIYEVDRDEVEEKSEELVGKGRPTTPIYMM